MAEEERRSNRDANECTDVSDDGRIFYFATILKESIFEALGKELDIRFKGQEETLTKKFESTCAEVMARAVREASWTVATGEGSRSSDQLSRLRQSALPLPMFAEVAGAKEAVIPLLQWTTLSTVVSFAERCHIAREWVPGKIYEKTWAGSIDIVSGSSGLSAVLFSVKANEAKSDKLECAVGRLWSFILRNAICTVLRNALLHKFSPREAGSTVGNVASETQMGIGDKEIGENSEGGCLKKSAAPAWLLSFGKRAATSSTVNRVVDRLEGKDDAGAPSKKRRMIKDNGKFVDTLFAATPEMVEESQFQAVKQIRSIYMTLMNHGRTEVRAHLFSELFFVTECIAKHETLEEARKEGFEVVFEAFSPEESGIMDKGDLKGSLWDIANARTSRTGVPDLVVDQANRESMRQLQIRFPSLSVILKYRKMVSCPEQDGGGERPNVSWPVEERVSLHRVAAGVLTEIYKAGSRDVVLSSSPYSLKAVHVIAIGLRGLLRKFLSLDLVDIEKHALGEVKHNEVRKGENAVTVLMDTKPRKDAKGPKRLDKIRAKKFSMTWGEYEAAKAKEEEENRRKMQTAASSMQLEDDESDDDIFFNL